MEKKAQAHQIRIDSGPAGFFDRLRVTVSSRPDRVAAVKRERGARPAIDMSSIVRAHEAAAAPATVSGERRPRSHCRDS
jgi:hypothetical protein